MIEVIFGFVLLLVLIQVLLLIRIKKNDKIWLYSIITVFISILIFIAVSQIESIVHMNSPGLGEIGIGIITLLIRVISLVLSEIILYKSIKKSCESNNDKFINFLIAVCIIFIGFIIFIVSQVGLENLRI